MICDMKSSLFNGKIITFQKKINGKSSFHYKNTDLGATGVEDVPSGRYQRNQQRPVSEKRRRGLVKAKNRWMRELRRICVCV